MGSRDRRMAVTAERAALVREVAELVAVVDAPAPSPARERFRSALRSA